MADFILPTGSTLCKIDDTTTADTTYLGYAERGTALSSSEWVIKRVTTTGIAYGEGSYNDRVSLSYVENL